MGLYAIPGANLPYIAPVSEEGSTGVFPSLFLRWEGGCKCRKGGLQMSKRGVANVETHFVSSRISASYKGIFSPILFIVFIDFIIESFTNG